jgi:tetratricopeptide (TPR) repeat protein
MLVTILAGTSLGVWWIVHREHLSLASRSSGDLTSQYATSPTSPPPLSLDIVAEVLGLDARLPHTVEALKIEALQACERLVADWPGRPESHAVRALFSKRFGNTADAERSWRESLKIKPDFAPALLGLGAVAAEKADYEAASDLLSRALASDPMLDGAYRQLTEVLLDLGQAEHALSIAHEYVSRFPESRESHYWLGQTYLQLKRYTDAKTAHEVALRIDPNLTVAYHALATACMCLGDSRQAAVYRKKFATLKKNDMQVDRGRNKLYRDLPAQQEVAATAHLLAGNVYLTFGDPRKAEAHWLRGAAIAVSHAACREALARLYERQARFTWALEKQNDLVHLAPPNAGYWVDLGRLRARTGAWEPAEMALQKALELAPQSGAAYQELVDIALRSGRHSSEVVAWAERAVSLAPTAQAYVQLSAVRQECGNRLGAIAALEEALKLEPANSQLRQMHAELKQH